MLDTPQRRKRREAELSVTMMSQGPDGRMCADLPREDGEWTPPTPDAYKES